MVMSQMVFKNKQMLCFSRRQPYIYWWHLLSTVTVHVTVAGSMWYSNRSDVIIQSSPTILHNVDTSNTNSSKHFSGSGTSSGPRYCRHSSDCGDTQLGQTCYWLYDGCNVGRCMCDPKRHTQQATGKCTQFKEENELCSVADGDRSSPCQRGMSCIGGRCRCPYGASIDGQHCLRFGEKLLGQKCTPSVDICLQRASSGYTRYDTVCNAEKRQCTCTDGYKTDGYSCKKWNIDESGCRKSIHCEGGALCIDERCSCPTTHIAIAGNSKCAKIGAVIDLPNGAVCDEINETRYCAQSLVCLRCPDDNVFKCVRFLMHNEYAYLWSSSADHVTDTIPATQLYAISTIVLIIITTPQVAVVTSLGVIR